VGARQKAELAELADWVEGLRAAAHTARVQGKITLAEALDITRFEVYEGYLDEELDQPQSQAVDDQKLSIGETVGVVTSSLSRHCAAGLDTAPLPKPSETAKAPKSAILNLPR
jgi:hypothetical protein